MTDELLVGLLAEEPLRSRMAHLLRRDGMEVVAEAASAQDLVRACSDRRPHIAVHAWTGATNDASNVRRLISGMPSTRVVAVVPSTDRTAVRAALGAGADGVVVAVQVAVTLAIVVRAVWLGQTSVPRAAGRDVETPVLSHREQEVLALAAEGLGNTAIAARLCVTENTVKSHLSSLFAKLGAHSRMEAVAMVRDRNHAIGHGLVKRAARTRAIHGGPTS
jgi:DNA-binding NarL/FixJ family response regulator